MRIDVISQVYLPEPGGMYIRDLAAHWAGCGHAVRIWTATMTPGREESARISIHRIGGMATPYDRRSMVARLRSQGGFLLSCADALMREARKTPPDVILAAGSPAMGALLAGLLPLPANVRRVSWIMDLYPDVLFAHSPDSVLVRAGEFAIRRALDSAWARSDAVVALSPRMSARLQTRLPKVQIHTIPLWAPASIQASSARSLALRRRRGIPPDAFVVAYHGNLGLAYDLEPLLDA